MNRTAALLAGTVALVGVAAPHSIAGPKKPKPITKTYSVTAPAPDPTNYAGEVTGGYSVCAQNVPQSFHREAFKVPAAGSLKVTLKDYQGDWDLLLMNKDGDELTYAGASDLGVPEVMAMKFKKSTSVVIVACNWAGGSSGTVTYTFTYK